MQTMHTEFGIDSDSMKMRFNFNLQRIAVA